MELIVIRHGLPLRVEGVEGGADPDLDAIGHEQAAAMAGWMKDEHLDAIYASPMARARQTSAPLEETFELAATVEPRIKEFDAEHSDYIPMEHIRADKAQWKKFLAEQIERDLPEFAATVMAGVDDIVARHRGQRVAMVCHGGVINVVAARLTGQRDRMFFNPYYTSINRFMFASSGESSIVSLNDTGHLRAHPHLRQ